MPCALQTSVDVAIRQVFLPDARVAGVLVNADIGPVCWGDLHGADRPPGQEFIRFEAVGIDHRNGWTLVRSAEGVAYVVVSYAPHAARRGMSHLREHIAVNPGWYSERLASTWGKTVGELRPTR